jgi:hypothetical protein
VSTSRKPFAVPEVPEGFIIRLAGKDYVTANGLIYLGHLQGLRRVTVEALKLPSEKDPSALVRVEVETDLGTFSDYGEVGPANKGQVGGAYPLSLATTRARNRALRLATGCPLTSYEEMGTEPAGEHPDEQDEPAAKSRRRSAPEPEPAPDPARALAYARIDALRTRLRATFGVETDEPADDLTLEQARTLAAFLTARGVALRDEQEQRAALADAAGRLHAQLLAHDPDAVIPEAVPADLADLRAYVQQLRAAVSALEAGAAEAEAAAVL